MKSILGNDPEKDEADNVVVANVVEAAVVFIQP